MSLLIVAIVRGIKVKLAYLHKVVDITALGIVSNKQMSAVPMVTITINYNLVVTHVNKREFRDKIVPIAST